MLKALAVVAMTGILAGSAAASDMPRRAPTAVTTATATVDWTGFHVGGHLSWGAGPTDWNDPASLYVPAGITEGIDVSGALVGAQVGAAYQIGRFVLGIEADLAWSGVVGDKEFADPFLVGNGDLYTLKSEINWLASVTARLGITHDRMLLYVKGGPAWIDEDAIITIASPGNGSGVVSGGGTRTGWTVGAGLAWAWTPAWSLRAEYGYFDFGARTVGVCGLDPTIPATGCGDARIASTLHLVRFGVDYRFGAPGPAVTAKY